MLVSFKVYSLYYIKGNNRNIDFNEDITIIAGQNGAGKTTVLGMLNAIITKNFEMLLKFDFKKAKLVLTDSDITVTQTKNEITIEYNLKNEFGETTIKEKMIIKKNHEEKGKTSGKIDSFNSLQSMYFPTYRRLETDLFELLTNKVSDSNRERNYYMHSQRIFKDVLNEIDFNGKNQVNNIVMGLTNNDIHTIIGNKWKEIIEFEKKKLNDLIRNYIFSLIDLTEVHSSSNTFNTDMEQFNSANIKNELIEMFTKAGFIEDSNDLKVESLLDVFTNEVKNSINYLDNNLGSKKKKKDEEDYKKLSYSLQVLVESSRVFKLIDMYKETQMEINEAKKPFNNLIASLREFIDLEINLIEGKLLFKETGIEIEEEFIDIDSHNNTELTFDNLSAGEKQLVSMFVYAMLSSEDGHVIIIDEPELSLHINWQRKLLKHLTQGKNKIQFIVATHSPFIISNYKDKSVPFATLGDDSLVGV